MLLKGGPDKNTGKLLRKNILESGGTGRETSDKRREGLLKEVFILYSDIEEIREKFRKDQGSIKC